MLVRSLYIFIFTTSFLFAKTEYVSVKPISIEKVVISKTDTPKQVEIVKVEDEDTNEDIFDELPPDDENISNVELSSDDEDGDGVDDSLDLCPNTPAIFEVNEDGCAKKTTLDLKFSLKSYEVIYSDLIKLKELASFLKNNKNYQVIIYVFFNKNNDEKKDKAIAQKMADNIKDNLLKFDVGFTKLTAIGRSDLELMDSKTLVEIELIY